MRLVFVVAIAIAGCIDSESVECGFGLCPAGSQCDEDGKACIPAGCGNGVVEGTEECDGAVDANHDCTTYGYYLPNGLACSRECTYDTSACSGGQCGDHATNGPELCDGKPPLGLTCADFGFQIGRLACGVDCAPAFGGCGELGWHPGRGNALDEMHAVWGTPNGQHIYAVGRGGHILESNGVVWVEVPSPTTNNLDGIWGVNKDNIYAVGAAGTIIHYNGTAWSTMPSGTSADLHAISGLQVDPMGGVAEMWAVGDGGTILHASSANASWTSETSNTAANLKGVWAYGVDAPVAVGEAITTGTASPTALIRTSGTWTAMTVPAVTMTAGATASLDAVWGAKNPINGATGFVAVGTVTSSTGRGIVLATQNPLTTWAFTGQSIATTDLKSVWGALTNRVDVYIGGLSGVLLHWDGTSGPTHFAAFNSNTSRGIRGLWGINPVFIKGATLGGEVLEYDGTDVQSQDLALLDASLVAHTANAVWADPATQNVVAVGDLGRVSRHSNLGWTTPQQVNTQGPWNAVWGTGLAVFIAGANGQGLATSGDGGANFGGGSLTTVNWFGLWGTSATDVYAVGSLGGATGALAHYNGAWTQLADVGTKRLNAIWGTSDTDIFVVGNNGFIAHSANGGTSWTPQTSPVTSVALNAVWGAAANDVWAVGGSGTILHYDGTAWRQLTSGTAQDLYAVGGTSANDVFAGGRGTLLHWQGIQWQGMGVDIEDVYGMAIERVFSYAAGTVLRSASVDAGVLQFARTPTVDTELICADAWDNDGDGLVGCEDPDCACATQPCGDTDYKGCQAGGACAPTLPLACGEATTGASTFSGIARIDDLPCLDHATPGPEASYRFVADHDGTVMVTFDDPSGKLDLVQLDPFDNLSVSNHRRVACDIGHCVAAPTATGTRTLMIDAKQGETYYLLVDGPTNTAGEFTLSLDCP